MRFFAQATLVVITILFPYKGAIANTGVTKYLDEARKSIDSLDDERSESFRYETVFSEQADHSMINLSLPDSARNGPLPIKLVKSDVGLSNQAGLGWDLSIPYIEIDEERTARGGGSTFYYSNSFGQLSKKGSNYYPHSLNNDNSLSCLLETINSRKVWYCRILNENLIWVFGETDASTLTLNNKRSFWSLTSIVNQFDEKISFQYIPKSTNYNRLPVIKRIDLPNRNLAIDFKYDKILKFNIFEFRDGHKVEGRFRLIRIIVAEKTSAKPLYENRLGYEAVSNDSILGYLQKISRFDSEINRSSYLTPLVETEFCYSYTCRSLSEYTAFNSSIYRLPRTFDQDFKNLRFGRYASNGLAGIVWPETAGRGGIKYTKPIITIPQTTDNLATISHEKIVADLGNGPSNSAPWGMKDYDGDSCDDLWWVRKSTPSTAERNTIYVALCNEDGTYEVGNPLRFESLLPLSARGLVEIGRLDKSGRNYFVNVSGSKRIVEIGSFDVQKQKFIRNELQYSDIFPTPPVADNQNGIMLFHDHNNDSLDDMLEVVSGSDGRVGLKIYFSTGDLKFTNPVSCDLPYEFSDPSKIDFFDINRDGWKDIISFYDDKFYYAINRKGHCFVGLDGTIEEAIGIDLGSRVDTYQIADMDADGFEDLVVNKSRYISTFPQSPGADKVTSYTNNLGLETKLEWKPISQFYTSTPLKPELLEAKVRPRIKRGFHVVSDLTSHDKDGTRTEQTKYKYYGPVHWPESLQFGGFQLIETYEVGDESQPTAVTQTSFDLKEQSGPWHSRMASVRTLTGAGKVEKTVRFKYRLLGNYDNNDPLNTSESPTLFRTILSSIDTEYPHPQTPLKYTNNFDYERIGSTNYFRLKTNCEIRNCIFYTYADSFVWKSKISMRNFYLKDSVVKSERTEGSETIGKKLWKYHSESGLVESLMICADNACKKTDKKNLYKTYKYTKNGWPKIENYSSGLAVTLERSEKWPLRINKTKLSIPATSRSLQHFEMSRRKFTPFDKPEKFIDEKDLITTFEYTSQGIRFSSTSYVNSSDSKPYMVETTHFDPISRTLTTKWKPSDSTLDPRFEQVKLNSWGATLEISSRSKDLATITKFEIGKRGWIDRRYLPVYKNEEAIWQEFDYDLLGRKTRSKDFSKLITSFEHRGSWVKATSISTDNPNCRRPSGCENQPYKRIFQYRQDGVDIVEVIEAEKSRHVYKRDGEGKIISYTTPMGVRRSYDYDYRGRLESISVKGTIDEGLKKIKEFDYGPHLKPIEIVELDSDQSLSRSLDGFGRVLGEDFKVKGEIENRISFYYDRPARSNFSNGESVVSKHQMGLLTQVENKRTFQKYTLYNERGLQAESGLSIRKDNGDWSEFFKLTTQFGNFDEPVLLTYPDEFKVLNELDSLGRVTATKGKRKSSSNFQTYADYRERSALGFPLDIVYGNQMTVVNTFERRQGRITNILSRKNIVSNNFSAENEYIFNQFRELEILSIVSSEGNSNYNYEYSNKGELKKAEGPYGNLNYEYEINGSFTSFEGKPVILSPNFHNRPDKFGNKKIEYDTQGRMSQKGKNIYRWGLLGHLNSMCLNEECSGSNSHASYFYDEQGNKIFSKNEGKIDTIYISNLFEYRVSEGLVVRHIRGSADIVSSIFYKSSFPLLASNTSLDPNGPTKIAASESLRKVSIESSLASGFIKGTYGRQGIDSPTVWRLLLLIYSALIACLLWWLRRRSIELRGRLLYYLCLGIWTTFAWGSFAQTQVVSSENRTLYYANDHTGSISYAMNRSGELVRHYILKPFGQIYELKIEKKTYEPRYIFHSTERDRLSELDFMGARIYDSELGQFISRDPLFETSVELAVDRPSELNLYSFASNNPLKYRDPSGKYVESALDIASIGVGITSVNKWDEGTSIYAKSIDLVGLAADAAALAVPFVPGGVSLGIKAGRSMNIANDLATTSKGLGSVSTSSQKSTLVAGQVGLLSASNADVGPERKGVAGGARAGRGFTKKGKKEVIEENRKKNEGSTVCEDCATETVPAKKGSKGVTPPNNETNVDHVHPRSKDGDGSVENGQVLCRSCNLIKGDKWPYYKK